MFFRRIKRSFEDLLAVHLHREYEATDFGRRYGWWLCLREKRVADLNYWKWDSDSQFWHQYHLFAFDPAFAEIGFDSNRWCLADISLESRYAEGFFLGRGILMASHGGNLVAIRSAHIPVAEFMRVVRRSRENMLPP
jgi:hypothetical protein